MVRRRNNGRTLRQMKPEAAVITHINTACVRQPTVQTPESVKTCSHLVRVFTALPVIYGIQSAALAPIVHTPHMQPMLQKPTNPTNEASRFRGRRPSSEKLRQTSLVPSLNYRIRPTYHCKSVTLV